MDDKLMKVLGLVREGEIIERLYESYVETAYPEDSMTSEESVHVRSAFYSGASYLAGQLVAVVDGPAANRADNARFVRAIKIELDRFFEDVVARSVELDAKRGR